MSNHRNADSGSGGDKGQPLDVNADSVGVGAEEPATEDVHGGGSNDAVANSQTGDIGGGDTEKTGAKQPDAMGAGA
ncbi:MAG TPA: hypothetical protein VF719_09280 [Abditibacteriaceae bacterium]|jgi:hypothetical protein